MVSKLLTRIATFGAVAVLSGFLLMLYPFYPLYITIIIALVMGAVALEFPYLGLIIAILLSVLGAFYQNALIGLTFLVVFFITLSLAGGWLDIAFLVGSWILAFISPLASLAIAPTVLAGVHGSREEALKVGAISGLSIFLLSWTRNITQAGLMLVPSPSAYAPKPIPEPWSFTAFVPNADMFGTTRLTDYFGPLTQNLGDFRIYALIATWAIAGYLTAFLVSKWKGGVAYIGGPVVGVLPAVVVSFLFAQTSLLGLGAALVAAAVISLAYRSVQPIIAAPALGAFTGLEELVPTGIPQKYALLLGSPSCDERNLVVEQFIQSGVKKKMPSFLVTTDPGFAQSAVSKFGQNLTVLVANPRATAGTEKNMIPVPTGVQNLTALNIELVNVAKDHAGAGARICLDVLSDVMLAQKMLMTRKWVTDIVPRLQSWGFMALGVFNPGLHSNEEVQGLVELFNGYVEIFEKEYAGRTRKLIAVRKMADLQYNENELLIDKQQLQRGKGGFAAFREKLSK